MKLENKNSIVETYVRAPLKIEAIQWDGSDECSETVISWITEKNCMANKPSADEISIRAGYGVITAHKGDWIIYDHRNEFHISIPEDFSESYIKIGE